MTIRERSLIRGGEHKCPVPLDINKNFLSARLVGNFINIHFLMNHLSYDDALQFKVLNVLDCAEPEDKFLFSFEENGYDFFLFVGEKSDKCE